ncbi:hypothetical protein GCM10010919_08780 [Alishewanella longhuensis]|uniref:Lipoprotein n=1 Tax=Alishewanella longhuensis TaxID=1091037 RepID=A0ABQ3KVR7_9ALTE|nr:hypothetical protein [Alishewanella longhuensis]GHG63254.1 hypothetical protein GCM10010919_08780 [Alishewanella longhuensis]
MKLYFQLLLLCLLLGGCSGSDSDSNSGSKGKTLHVTLNTNQVNIKGDMYRIGSLRQAIGTTNHVFGVDPALSFSININHTILDSVEISADNGVVYASVYNKHGYPFVNLNEPTTITLSGTITACVQNCAVVLQGTPAPFTINIIFEPAEVAELPELLTYTSAQADNPNWLEISEIIRINNSTQDALFNEVTYFDPELLQSATLRRVADSTTDYRLTLRFNHQDNLANRRHTGQLALRFCYDSACRYPVKNGQPQLTIHYDQLGEPYQTYPEITLAAQLLPADFYINGDIHYLPETQTLFGVMQGSAEHEQKAYSIKTASQSQFQIEGDTYNAVLGEGYYVAYSANFTEQGYVYRHHLYRWEQDKLSQKSSFDYMHRPWNPMAVFAGALYTHSNDDTTPYRYNIATATFDYGGFYLSHQHLFDNETAQLYNFLLGEQTVINQWSLQDEHPKEIISTLLTNSRQDCWINVHVVNRKLLNRCGESYNLPIAQTEITTPDQKLVVPDSHAIHAMTKNHQNQLVVVLTPKESPRCNPIKSYCSWIITRYNADTLQLIDSYGWSDQPQIFAAMTKIFFQPGSDALLLVRFEEQGVKLYQLEWP